MVLRLKTSVAAMLICALLTPSLGVQAQADIANTRYSEAFNYLVAHGAVRGYGDGTARPYALLNRAEAVKTIMELQPKYRTRVEWHRNHLSSLPLFLDYQQTAWFAPYVEAGFEADVIKGYPNRTFRPANTLTTEEAIALVMRAYKQNPSQTGGDWYAGYVQLALQKNIVFAGERLQIGQSVTRGQFFDMLYRMESVQSQNIVAYIDTVQPPQNSQPIIRPTPAPTPSVPSNPTPGNPGDAQQYGSNKAFAITIPRLGITDLTISHPRDALTSPGLLSVLKDGVGHLFSYPGKDGKIMIYGHSSGYAWDVSKFTKIFRRVNELRAGDRVYVTYNGTLHVYQVTGQQTIAPNDVNPFRGRGEELILFTCWPPDSIKQRLIVRALPVSTVALR